MNKREKYVEALKSLNGWVEISVWGEQVSKMFPELLKDAEEQAQNQKSNLDGQGQINARLGSRVSEDKFPEVEVDDTVKPKKVRYIENYPKVDSDKEGKLMSTTNTQKYYDSYRDAGFHFPTSILTTYAISLHTKPFVLLSGISGTGKTKIAQLFHIPNETEIEIEEVKKLPMLTIKIPSVFDRFNFPQDLLPEILTAEELEKFEENAQEYRDRNDGGNFSEIYILDIEDDFGEFNVGIYGQRANSPLIRGRYYRSNRDRTSPQYDAREHLSTNYNAGDILTLEKIGDKRFKVVSLNNQEVVKKVREYELATLDRHCFIPVRSDWTDNNELFGFYNLIEQKYHVPKFLDFLLTAMNNPEYPFFILLDEMNLSKVEHYFSDILSCLESRIVKNGTVTQEKITLHNGIKQLATDSEDFEYIPNAVEIPLNLHFTGTVNIDESTYMFSPKVLDRANVIEFNTVDLPAYGTGKYVDNEDYKLSLFPDFTMLSLATKEDYENLSNSIKDHLVELNRILEKYNLHFGYRTANEVALYIHNAAQYIEDTDEVKLRALDFQLIQKVFPKLNGGYASLEEPLREVLLYLSEKSDLQQIDAPASKFPRTIRKLQRLYDKLSKNGYASFID